MTFQQLYSLVLEAQYISSYRQRRTVNLPNDSDYSTDGMSQKLDAYIERYGIHTRNYEELIEKLSNEHSYLLFRGHKTVDPFDVDVDTKSPPGTVYWAKDPKNAVTFLRSTNTGGTQGRSYTNILHKILGKYSGFLTIARPKNKNVEWFDDFGVETFYKSRGQPKDDFIQKPGRKSWYPGYEHKPFVRGETALGKNDIERFTTYIWVSWDPGGKLLSLKKLAQIDRKLYDIITKNKIETSSGEKVFKYSQEILKREQEYNFEYQQWRIDYYGSFKEIDKQIREITTKIEELEEKRDKEFHIYSRKADGYFRRYPDEGRALFDSIRKQRVIIGKLKDQLYEYQEKRDIAAAPFKRREEQLKRMKAAIEDVKYKEKISKQLDIDIEGTTVDQVGKRFRNS
jgi:hypothetical protein